MDRGSQKVKGYFRVDIGRIRAKIGESVTQRAERITQKLVDGFIDLSPVDSGNFRASWNVTEGFPDYMVVTNGVRGAPLGAPEFRIKAKSLFPVFYITNGQPYGEMLEDGWSQTQAPYGMVRITIASLR